MAYRFQCTACGKCCYGQVPLTIADAFRHAERFPLAMVWTPVREASKDFAMVAQLGAVFGLPNRKRLAALIVPTAYLPPTVPCPALGVDKLCSIHADKPLRCRTMPFYPYREEQYQAELLKFPADWACDVSDSAPIVFADKRITVADDFELERQALMAQQPQIQRYAEYMLKYTPRLLDNLSKASLKAKAGQVVTSLSSFLTATRNPDAKHISQQQLPVLEAYSLKTADQTACSEFHQYYQMSAKEMRFLANRP
jgi:Fe-S-cluster containining protein